ncbi:UPF0606 protein KIAA1549 [Salvelinus namaycush]|uniref:UPF0606 protein KIAA1549 n=1 Tax=Salvelinus namaycush TaxID=8040 RepID=A0A8U0TZL6_SALNM|nr:UPF0606 protein KIAA1549 [Salvelinus namaycush]
MCPGISQGLRTNCAHLLVASLLVSMTMSSSPVAGGVDSNGTTATRSSSRSSPSPSSRWPGATPPKDTSHHGNTDAASVDDEAQGIHLLLRPPDLLSPSHPPPLPPHSQPTLTPPPPWEHAPSLEEAWGSGDYLETLSFMVPEGEELALATSLPSHTYDPDDGASYDTSFPSRPTLPLSSSLLRPYTSPTSPLREGLPFTHPAQPEGYPHWDEEDYDLGDIFPLVPTELLLPDMNSLEYYTNLLGTPTPGVRPTSRVPPQPPVLRPRVPPATPGRHPPLPPSNTTSLARPPMLRPPGRDPIKPPPPVTEVPSNRPTTTTKATTVTTTTPGTLATPPAPPGRQYLCNVTKPDMYLVRVVLPKSGSTVGFGQVRDILKREFNRSVELQFLRTPSSFAFRVVAGPLIFTAMSVVNALRQSTQSSSLFPTVSPLYGIPDRKYQIRSVLQFVPGHVDVRVCNFSERVERGLLMAYTETRRRAHEFGNVTVQLLNITMGQAKPQGDQKVPVDITFALRDGRGYLLGSEVSGHLRRLSTVEFSFYLGFPALQIAEPFHYPELNVSHHLRSSWVRTVLLGVQEQTVTERSFKARLERRLALLLEEGLGEGSKRPRWKRSTAVGNNSLQVVRVSRLAGSGRTLEVVYFVEGPEGERVPADATAATLNRLELQRAAIVLGHRVQRPLAQPVETLTVPPSETQSSSVWLIVGVVVPVLLAIFIIIILYWKLCGSEKLEFQPDAINTIQQRQKLQAPSVKGFDFAKLHLGQHSKDDIMVIQEPGSLPVPIKEATPSEGGDLNTPKSKGSSTKASRANRRRGRLSPSDGDSLGSDQSSGRESAEETTRYVGTPHEGKPHRNKTPKNVYLTLFLPLPVSRSPVPPTGSGPDELLSSSSIFDHVDRLSRGSSDGRARQANKVQLIAMQPRPSPPQHSHSPTITERVSAEVALRHKSEIEHHRNKLRQRAKRRGQCEFPSMDDILDAFGQAQEEAGQGGCPQRLYSSAHDHMDSILHTDPPSPPTPGESRKRGRRSPRGRRRQQGNGSLPDTDRLTDRDRLLTDHSATYRKYPGLNNVAYMSDPDLPPDHGSPSPNDEVFDHAPPPPPYVPPQPSIEEARQQMHSLLDDAFALVSPSSQGSVGVTQVSPALPSPSPSPQTHPSRQWGSYPAAPTHSPFSARYAELGMSPSSIQGLLHRQGLGSGAYVAAEEQLQDSVYANRGQYEEPPSSSRPRPVGGSTGAQLHHLTQVGLSSRISAYPGVGRSVSGPTGSSWNQQPLDQDLSRPGASRETVLSFPEFSSSGVFQMPSSSLGDHSVPPMLLAPPTPEFPLDESSPSAQSSASLIKAIREELRRLAQKQVAVASSYS